MWPTCSRSKQPLARTIVRPSARSRATASISCDWETTSPMLVTRRSFLVARFPFYVLRSTFYVPASLRRPFLGPVFRCGVVIARDGIGELACGHGGGAALHHDQAAGVIGEAGCLAETPAGREGQPARGGGPVAGPPLARALIPAGKPETEPRPAAPGKPP